MNTKHTPGPWTFIETGTENASVRIDYDCVVAGSYRGGDSDILSHADARLIASAPELFEIARKLTLLCPSSEGLGGHAPINAFLQLGEEARKIVMRATSS